MIEVLMDIPQHLAPVVGTDLTYQVDTSSDWLKLGYVQAAELLDDRKTVRVRIVMRPEGADGSPIGLTVRVAGDLIGQRP